MLSSPPKHGLAGDCGPVDEDCPICSDPLPALLTSLETVVAQLDADSESLGQSVRLVGNDLTSPSTKPWSNALPVLASVLSYLAVVGFLMAFSYLRAYNRELIGNQPIAYGFLDTMIGSWQTLLSAGSMLLGMAIGLASLSLGLTSETRRALRDSYRSARLMLSKAAAVKHQLDAGRDQISAASNGPAAPETERPAVSKEEIASILKRVDAAVTAVDERAKDHWHLVNRAARLEPGTWLALRLSTSDHRHRVWAGLLSTELLALVAAIVSAVALSGRIPGVGRTAAGIGMYAVVAIAFGCFWLMANVADFSNGPGSKSARVAVTQIMVFGFLAALGVLGAMGVGDGMYARANPSTQFEKATVHVASGPDVVGYIVPISSSQDAFVLTSDSPTSSVTRVPAAQVRSIVLVPRRP